VYGLERFIQYTYGRNVVVHNDHSPLEFIFKKNLSQAPKRLQALIMRLHKYDITFQYVPGRSLVLADTLGRAFPTQRNSQEHLLWYHKTITWIVIKMTMVPKHKIANILK